MVGNSEDVFHQQQTNDEAFEIEKIFHPLEQCAEKVVQDDSITA